MKGFPDDSPVFSEGGRDLHAGLDIARVRAMAMHNDIRKTRLTQKAYLDLLCKVALLCGMAGWRCTGISPGIEAFKLMQSSTNVCRLKSIPHVIHNPRSES